MIIRKYGVELHRLTHDDIELVRQERNRPDIRSKMFEQALITPEQQEAWFHSIDNMYNYFYLIHHRGRKIGLVSGKDIDFDKREIEAGIFIWDSTFWGTPVPAKVSILFMEASFTLALLEKIFAKVRRDNHRGRRYNLELGYVPTDDPDWMVLTRTAYDKNIDRFRKLANGGKNTPPLSIQDVEIPNASQNSHLYERLPEDIFNIFKPKLAHVKRRS